MNCKRCQEEYEPQYLECMGIKLLRGDGYCLKCAKEVLAEQEAKEKSIHEARLEATRYNRIGESGIPPRFLTESFSSFDKGWQDKALAYCKKYADDFPVDKWPIGYPSLYLWSAKTWGTGKTHLSCAIALRIFERWDGEPFNRWTGEPTTCPKIYFVSEVELFQKLLATINYTREERETKDSEAKIINGLIKCDLLILDDVGKQTTARPDFVQRILFGLINSRYDDKLPMILTANVNADGLKAHLGGASFDRFFEMIGGKSVCMDGDSYRREVEP